MIIKIEFSTDNNAFDYDYPVFEAQRMIRKAGELLASAMPSAQKFESCIIPLHDSNGNRIGQIEVSKE